MTYFSDNYDHMYVKISSHFKKVILINKDENYLMEIPEDSVRRSISKNRDGG